MTCNERKWSANDIQTLDDLPTSRRNPFTPSTTPSPKRVLQSSPFETTFQRKASSGSKTNVKENSIDKWTKDVEQKVEIEEDLNDSHTLPLRSQISLTGATTTGKEPSRDLEANRTPRMIQSTRFIPQTSKMSNGTLKKFMGKVKSAFIPSSTPSESQGGTEVEVSLSIHFQK